MLNEDDLLDILISTATEEDEKSHENQVLKEVDIFQDETNEEEKTEPRKGYTKSLIHSGDTDSSDDEDNRNPEDQKYNDSGKEIKRLVSDSQIHTKPVNGYNGPRERISWKPTTPTRLESPKLNSLPRKLPEEKKDKFDVFIDPIFGLRIVNPIISSAVLQERMAGRHAVQCSFLSRYLQTHTNDKDWVVAGVVANKSTVKTSQKGQKFLIWTLTDLKNDIQTVSVFLFGSAYTQLWKTQVGVVVGILNPNVLDKREGSKDVASLSIDNSQKVMIFGISKDLGTCKSIKKNGEKCTAIVNVNRCEFCIYHVKQEYQKCSLRSELQSNFAGKGLVALRNKVLGKNEVFYAGKSYMAIPAKKNRKLEQKDNNRLDSLNGLSTFSNNIVKAKKKGVSKKAQNAARFDVSVAQRKRDLELLQKLGGTSNVANLTNFNCQQSTEVTIEKSKDAALSVIGKLKAKNVEKPNVAKLNTKENDARDDPSEEIRELNLIDMFDDDFNLEYEESIAKNTDENHHGDANSKKSPKNSPTSQNKKENAIPVVASKKIGSPVDSVPGKKTKHNEQIMTRKESNTKEHPNIILSPKNAIAPLKTPQNDPSCVSKLSSPNLSRFGFQNGFVDLNEPLRRKTMNKAKLNAIKVIQDKGPIKKIDPNSTKTTPSKTKKRITQDSDVEELNPKKSKLAESDLISDRFKRMMAVKSRHADLVEQRDDEETEKYFRKQEMKEQMEEKMANTFKIACKAVRCLKCKYTSFSASDFCKKEGHPLKVFDAMKRFFKCGNCQNRTVSLEIVPTVPCKNCGSGKWEKTGMMKEKVIGVAHQLSIRGGEQEFVNSVVTDANINLMVPDD